MNVVKNDLSTLVEELVAEAEARNRAAANRMYEALAYIARTANGDARAEALSALKFRNGL